MKLGIHEGDIVAVIAVSLPEVIYSFYGLNRIGAVANMIDPRTSAEGIREYIEEADIKTVVVIDLAYEKIVKVIQKSGVKNVIVVSPAATIRFAIIKNWLSQAHPVPPSSARSSLS